MNHLKFNIKLCWLNLFSNSFKRLPWTEMGGLTSLIWDIDLTFFRCSVWKFVILAWGYWEKWIQMTLKVYQYSRSASEFYWTYLTLRSCLVKWLNRYLNWKKHFKTNFRTCYKACSYWYKIQLRDHSKNKNYTMNSYI